MSAERDSPPVDDDVVERAVDLARIQRDLTLLRMRRGLRWVDTHSQYGRYLGDQRPQR